MSEKRCFKCGETKLRSEFYKHPQMGDGLLGKCKSCTKKDTEERRQRLEAEDPAWVLSERRRHREKARKLRETGRAPVRKKPGKNIPHQVRASVMVNNAKKAGKLTSKPCEVCGTKKTQGHHEDYDKPLDVVWLCVPHHAARHVHINDRAAIGYAPLEINDWMRLRRRNDDMIQIENTELKTE